MADNQTRQSLPVSFCFQVVACPRSEDVWAFFVVNTGEVTLDQVTLRQLEHEWGVESKLVRPDATLVNLGPGEYGLLWEEADVEFRIDLSLEVVVANAAANVQVPCGYLYRRRGNDTLDWVESLNEAGCIFEVSDVTHRPD